MRLCQVVLFFGYLTACRKTFEFFWSRSKFSLKLIVLFLCNKKVLKLAPQRSFAIRTGWIGGFSFFGLYSVGVARVRTNQFFEICGVWISGKELKFIILIKLCRETVRIETWEIRMKICYKVSNSSLAVKKQYVWKNFNESKLKIKVKMQRIQQINALMFCNKSVNIIVKICLAAYHELLKNFGLYWVMTLEWV